ncbi:ATP-binding protein [Streptomyces uncialis]|uniref:ATP-binding protein n=1 Tax=Streptomyces uncialis TaxID=1048205 RepID=UPI000A4F5747|nr:ATP-binding protein [Streptomyces uncialis]WTE10027.1 ATP-binding protein [Streptomyces uncialis]
MVSVQAPPGGREVPRLRVQVLPTVLMAAVTGGCVAAVTEPARLVVVLCGVIGTVLVAAIGAETVRRGRRLEAQRVEHARQIDCLEGRIAAHDAELIHLGSQLLPDALFRLRQGESPAEVMRAVVDADPAYRDLPDAQRTLLKDVLTIVDNEEAMREATQRAFVNIARRVQAIVHQQAAELREMEEDHGRNPEVFDDLLRIDHGTALIGRLADSIAVLGGARPGRLWPKPVPLFSVLRGAMSRILEYRRVDLHSIAKVAIKGTHVEPLIHAAAELLDNATRYSPPHTRVHVTAVEVQTGIAIEIEDGGVSLSEEARLRAERMVAQAQAGIDLKDLGETPRLGMAVVGRLSQMFHMQVSLRQSAYGGVRAVLVVPRDMLTSGPAPGLAHGIGATAVPRVNDDGTPMQELKRKAKKRRPTTGPRRPSDDLTPTGATDDDVPVVTEWTANGLPQRRSRVKTPLSQRYAEAAASAAAEAAGEPDPWRVPVPAQAEKPDEPEPGLWVEAFMNGIKGAPTTPDTAGPDGTGPTGPDASGDPAAHHGPGGTRPGTAVNGSGGVVNGTAQGHRTGPHPQARPETDDLMDEGDRK